MEWNGVQWMGALSTNVDLKPPGGCNVRAIWMGEEEWTWGGEGDKPLVEGHSYSFTFTYAKNGFRDDQPLPLFAPIVYTDKFRPYMSASHRVGQLPGNAGGTWTTSTITFTAHKAQGGDDWLILHTKEASGIVLSNCAVDEPIEKDFLMADTTICPGDIFELKAPVNPRYIYKWNNGQKTSSIKITSPGWYSVEIKNYLCISKDSIYFEFDDCEVRLDMPNIFTPNDDDYNQRFLPKEHNYVESGRLIIYNRCFYTVISGRYSIIFICDKIVLVISFLHFPKSGLRVVRSFISRVEKK